MATIWETKFCVRPRMINSITDYAYRKTSAILNKAGSQQDCLRFKLI